MKKYFSYLQVLLLVGFFTFPGKALAITQIVANQETLVQGMYFPNEIKLPDPTQQELAVYGYLSTSYAVDSYYFIPKKTQNLSFEVLVPVRPSNENVRPAWEIIGPNIPVQPMNIEFSVPTGSSDIGHDYYVRNGTRITVYDPLSLALLYRGNRQTIQVIKNQMYYINIFEPFHYTGDYILRIQNSSNSSVHFSLKQLFYITFGLIGSKTVPWLDLIALLFILLGLLIGFGSLLTILLVHLIDTWQKKTLRMLHELQWLGLIVFFLGEVILYRVSLLSNIAIVQLFFYIVIVSILTFCTVRFNSLPDERLNYKKLTVEFTVLSFCWFFEMLLVVWYLFVTR